MEPFVAISIVWLSRISTRMWLFGRSHPLRRCFLHRLGCGFARCLPDGFLHALLSLLDHSLYLFPDFCCFHGIFPFYDHEEAEIVPGAPPAQARTQKKTRLEQGGVFQRRSLSFNDALLFFLPTRSCDRRRSPTEGDVLRTRCRRCSVDHLWRRSQF